MRIWRTTIDPFALDPGATWRVEKIATIDLSSHGAKWWFITYDMATGMVIAGNAQASSSRLAWLDEFLDPA